MLHKIFLIACLFLNPCLRAQTDSVWVSFLDESKGLSGYKYLNENIRIPAKFGAPTSADTFRHIIAVQENYTYYYLLKDGRKVGYDSVYVVDFTFNCVSEGKILFRDPKTDRVGYFDDQGRVIIPADYNYAYSFHNGVALAMKNAKRKCWDNGTDTLPCEHWGWDGGKMMLITAQNEVLVDSLTVEPWSLNWYSMRVNDPAPDSSVYVILKGSNGNTYWFMDYSKEFERWFYAVFMPTLKSGSNEELERLLFTEITYWTTFSNEWRRTPKGSFTTEFGAVLRDKWKDANERDISISPEDLNYFIFDSALYSPFYNSCGQPNKERYPLFNVMNTYYTTADKQEIDYQEHFQFLRTVEGYKLLSVSLKNVEGM